jgi:hypothetical protein
MKDAVDGYIAEIDKVVTHMRQTTLYTKTSQLAQATLQISGRLAFRHQKNPNDFCEFPVDNLPKILKTSLGDKHKSTRSRSILVPKK